MKIFKLFENISEIDININDIIDKSIKRLPMDGYGSLKQECNILFGNPQFEIVDEDNEDFIDFLVDYFTNQTQSILFTLNNKLSSDDYLPIIEKLWCLKLGVHVILRWGYIGLGIEKRPTNNGEMVQNVQ